MYGVFCVRNGSGRAEKWTSASPWSQEAKPKLSRALKLAHSQCCNHQLVAQSLSLIGTIVLDTRGGDLSQSLVGLH